MDVIGLRNLVARKRLRVFLRATAFCLDVKSQKSTGPRVYTDDYRHVLSHSYTILNFFVELPDAK